MGEIWLLEKAHWPHISSDIDKEKENLQNTVLQIKSNVEFLPLFNWDKLPKYHSKLSEYHCIRIQCDWTQRMQALATQQTTSKYIRLTTTTTYIAHDSAGHFYLSSHIPEPNWVSSCVYRQLIHFLRLASPRQPHSMWWLAGHWLGNKGDWALCLSSPSGLR